jgi:CRP-like cAMP-binding protein
MLLSALSASRAAGHPGEGAARLRRLDAGARLHDVRARPLSLTVLREGFAKAYIGVTDGGQQTVALFVPGDVLDLSAFLLGRTTAAIAAITPIRITETPHSTVRELIDARPAVGLALWRRLACQNALLQEWIVGLGRRSALSRTAHLMCEVSLRLSGASETGDTFDFPLTQHELADVLGLSVVHMNRVLQQLRAEGLIEFVRSRLTICDRRRLTEVADFDPGYLTAGDASAGRWW